MRKFSGVSVADTKNKIDDRILLKKATRDSCNTSLTAIHSRYAPFLTKYIARKIRCNHESKDLTQDVFLRICRRTCKYNGDSDARAFLCGIAKNGIKDHNKAKNNRLEVISIEQIDIDSYLTTKTPDETPPKNLQLKETSRILISEVEKLPQKARQAVKLVYLEGLRPIDAAKQADCSIETFHNRLNLGRKLLGRKLKNQQKNLSF